MKKASHWPLTLLGSLSSLLNLFLPIVMSRRMSPEGVGEFKVFFLYLAAIPALSMGVGFTNGTYLWGAERISGPEKVRSAFTLAVLAGLLASLLSLGAFFYFPTKSAVLWFSLCCIPMVAATIFEASLVAAGNVRRAAYFSAGFELVRLSCLIAALFLGSGVQVLFLFHALVSWIKLVCGAILLRPLSPLAPEFRRERSGLLRYALPVSGAAVFDLLVLNADRYVLSALLSAASFAVYSFGCLLVPPLFVFEQSVNQVLIPKLARTKPVSRAATALYQLAQEDLLLLLVPSAAGLMALAQPIVRLLFTDTYREAYVFLEWYAVYYALSGIPQDVLARARSDSGWIFRTALAFGLFAISASYLGARFFGALGALQAFILVQVARRLWGLIYVFRVERATWSAVFPVKSAVVIGAASGVAGVTAHFVSLLFSRPAPAFFLSAIVFAPIYFGLVYTFRPRAIARLLRYRRRR
jgi:O-antigen/teichoic acid export membrane protein